MKSESTDEPFVRGDEVTVAFTSAAELGPALGERMMCGMSSRAFGSVIRERDWWDEAMNLAASGPATGPAAQVAFRAAWSLEAAYFASPEAFAPYVGRFVEDFTRIKNRSVHRHYTKILYHLLRRGTVGFSGEGAASPRRRAVSPAPAAIILSPDRAEGIAEFCFDLLIDPAGKVAVKVWAMDILGLLAPRVEWVGEHLRETLEHQMASGSRAFVARGRMLLKKGF